MKNGSIRILAVGNSFSDDAFQWLHDLAEADGIDLTAVNLYIGGCNLETHWNNLCSGEKAYLYRKNGQSTDRYVSIQDALEEGSWDYIMTQQASHDSGLEETYFPYLENIMSFLRQQCPEATLLLHETWAYELDSDHSAFLRYNCNQKEMFSRLRSCYHEAACRLNLPLIPSGEVIQKVRGMKPFRYELGERSLCRDGYHMDLVYGRYLVAGVIYVFLTGRNLCENPFVPPEGDPEVLKVLKKAVQSHFQA